MAKWKRTIDLRSTIDMAALDADWIPAMLRKMASEVEEEDHGFACELRDAAEDIEDSDTPSEDADYWLREFYDWCDTMRVWVA